ncbi:MAG: family 78 glycoside hydrolase catalytic domain [Cyclobacteriaceae bacterium]|nr:family 78 glycoside hydrolase catalytic domain [Cyclobacteriaceae bacterium]
MKPFSPGFFAKNPLISGLFICATYLFFCVSVYGTAPLSFQKLLCDFSEQPDNIDHGQPAFSWIINAAKRNSSQKAFRITVATSEQNLLEDHPDLWDTGLILNEESLHHLYAGKPLLSNKEYFWQVFIRDNEGHELLSPIQRFTTAVLHQSDWDAVWIGAGPAVAQLPAKGFFMDAKEEKDMPDTIAHDGRSLLLRKSLSLGTGVKSARVFVSGLGFYELYINGKIAGNYKLNPAKTNYTKEVLYDRYDLKDFLVPGENVVGFHLGNGWYNPYKKWWKEYRMQWFGHKKAILQVHIEYEDGRREVITTDESWKTHPGPVLYNCIYDGEVYDAREETMGWNMPGYNDSHWKKAVQMQPPGGQMRAQRLQAMEIVEVKKPARNWSVHRDTLLYDMGQNYTGSIRIKLKGKKGSKMHVRFAEDVYDNGRLDITSNERAAAQAEYILKGEEEETYEPRFTYYGYQYAEITFEGDPIIITDVEGLVIHSNMPQSGAFNCSHDLINKIHHATVWSQKSNSIGYPMDCPQRDERLGWLGDVQVSAEQAMFNFDMSLFFGNWLTGIRKNQDEKSGDIPIISPRPYIKDEGVEWSSTYLIMVWQHYLYYGDKRILEEHYGAMKRYMEFLRKISTDNIVPNGWIGDWGSMVKGWKEGQPVSVSTAFYFYNARTLEKVAAVLGYSKDQVHFANLAQKIKASYNQKFFDANHNDYNDGSQMANAFALYLGLQPEERSPSILRNLVHDIVVNNNTHLTTGVLGTKYMIDALSMFNRSDISWSLATQITYPSWHAMMQKYNTMCEFWTMKQSKNHVMMGSIDAWFYKELAGIRMDENHPAFRQFTIRPYFADGLDFVNASFESIRGNIRVSWSKTEGSYVVNVTIPFNTTAEVVLPAKFGSTILCEGMDPSEVEGIVSKDENNAEWVIRAGSGSYQFEITAGNH